MSDDARETLAGDARVGLTDEIRIAVSQRTIELMAMDIALRKGETADAVARRYFAEAVALILKETDPDDPSTPGS